MLNLSLPEAVFVGVGVVLGLGWIWFFARRSGIRSADFRDVFVPFSAAAFIVWLVILAVSIFPLATGNIVLVTVCAFLASLFAEIKDSWKQANRQFSVPRVIFLTAQWAMLAVAGYIVVQVLGNMD